MTSKILNLSVCSPERRKGHQSVGRRPELQTRRTPLLPTVSSGVHYSHSPYYIRRVCIIATDPLCRVCEEPGYPVLPEVGQDPKDPTTKVLEFPVKAPAGRVKGDAAAIEQLENYKKMLMEHYVDHNCSITVHVRENEWEDVEHWDDVVALSFPSCDDSFYELLPYEEIDQAEYERRNPDTHCIKIAVLFGQMALIVIQINLFWASGDSFCSKGVHRKRRCL